MGWNAVCVCVCVCVCIYIYIYIYIYIPIKTEYCSCTLLCCRLELDVQYPDGADILFRFNIVLRTQRDDLLLTYFLTPWCRVLLEKLTGLQPVKKFPAFHGTRRFITALTIVRHLSLSWASPIQSIYSNPTSWRSILILSTHLCLGRDGLCHLIHIYIYVFTYLLT